MKAQKLKKKDSQQQLKMEPKIEPKIDIKTILKTEFKMRLRTKMFYTMNNQSKTFEKNYPWLDDTEYNLESLQRLAENYRFHFEDKKNSSHGPCALVTFIEFADPQKTNIICDKSINDVDELEFLMQTIDICL